MSLKKFNEETLVRFIQSKPDYPWDWSVLSHHPNLNLTTLKTFQDKPWNWEMVSGNDNFKWSWVMALPDKPWPWSRFDMHHNFDWRWVILLPNKQWNWRMLSHAITTPLQVSHFREKPWDWLILTLSDKIGLDFMMSHRDFPWVFGELFFRKVHEDTIEYLRIYRNSYTPVDWTDHTKHTRWYYIRSNLDLPWDLRAIKWEYGDITPRDAAFLIENHTELDMETISATADYHEVIKRIQGVQWDLKGISRNPTFTQKDMVPGCEYDLNRLHVAHEPEKWYAAQTIQRYWKRAITDPKRKICRDVFLRYMEDLTPCKHISVS